jgi:ActR/RegA family two-component response regulator
MESDELSDRTKTCSGATIVSSVAKTLGENGAVPLDTMIDLYVRATLAAHGGNKAAAARALGITRWRLQRLLTREAA